MPTKEAKHVAEFLYKMILRHGCPLEIVSDQGREFCNQLVDLLEELTGFKHKITSAYHPQSNGLDERFNQMLKAGEWKRRKRKAKTESGKLEMVVRTLDVFTRLRLCSNTFHSIL